MKKKMFKRAGVAVLSMAMLLSMGAVGAISASASTNQVKLTVGKLYNDTNGTTTLTEDTTATIKVYQVAYQDTVSKKWYWNAPYGTQDAEMSASEISTLKAKNAAQMNAQAATFAAQATDPTKVATGTPDTTLTLDDVTGVDVDRNAWYLVTATPTGGELVQPALIDIDGTSDITKTLGLKSTPIPFDKSITSVSAGDGEVAADNNSASAKIGATVNYQISTVLPTYEDGTTGTAVTSCDPFLITDDPDAGIAVDVSSVVVTINGTTAFTGGAAQTEFDGLTVAADNSTYGWTTGYDGFRITIPSATVIANQNKNVVVTFTATVDTDATTGSVSNKNYAKAEYSNNFSTGTGDTKTKEDTVNLYAAKLLLKKNGYKGDGSGVQTENLAATFTLQKDSDPATTINVTAGAPLDLGYLAAGTYTLTETTPPAGYKTVKNTYQFTVTHGATPHSEYTITGGTAVQETIGGVLVTAVDLSASGNTSTIAVNDPPADSLPGTGGMGTIMFTVGGAAIVLCAGFMFVIYMRKRRAEEE